MPIQKHGPLNQVGLKIYEYCKNIKSCLVLFFSSSFSSLISPGCYCSAVDNSERICFDFMGAVFVDSQQTFCYFEILKYVERNF